MAVITTRPFRTETPASTISPTAAETEKLIPVKMRVKIPPASPSGTVRKTAVARPADPRAMKSRTKMATKARSEEHTSELQSLMRTSYAVLCLKKNTAHVTNNGISHV